MPTKPGQQMRREADSLGEIEVPADRYWGAQTQRARRYFDIGRDPMPGEVIRALGLVKKAAALVNQELGKLPKDKAELIVRAADEVAGGKLADHFPLPVWISGSGTQANMNVNEVIANRANELATGVLGTKSPIHPNDHVNLAQSTNDVFPTAMNVAAALALHQRLIPRVRKLAAALREKSQKWAGIVKIGRTHLQDAVPLTLGQEFSGYAAMLDDNLGRLETALSGLYPLALGGTAVGTGLNAPRGFAERAAARIAGLTGLPFTSAPNKFAVQGAHDALVMASAVLKTLAGSLYKIANDIRLLAGLQELAIPANEPGSSIMPGKVNPTQCEALAMVAVQVMGLDAAVAFAGAGGYLEINVYKPLIIFNVLQAVRLLADSCRNFTDFLVIGLQPNLEQIRGYVERSLMLITALTPAIGYDRAARIAHLARDRGLTLKEAALELGYVSAEEFDRLVDPLKMTQPED